MPLFTRHAANPIVPPGLYDWRRCVVFNPGALDDDGRFYLYERAAGGLRPFHCSIGMLESDDGVRFAHTADTPVLTPEMVGSKYGSVQDPRVVRIDNTYYMTYAFRPFAWSCHPTGVGVPESHQSEFPGYDGDPRKNQTRSGIAVSTDRVHWKHLCFATPENIDDRDVMLFPEKIEGRYALLRRPLRFVGTDTGGAELGSIHISYSSDLRTWSDPSLVAEPAYWWESNRIGAAAPPIRTERGWLLLYHGVQTQDPALRRVCYRLGALMLDIDDPTRVLARTAEPIMEPREYYEKVGLFIPNVIFPTGAVVKDGLLYLYYGVCDTAIALATAPLDMVVEAVIGR
jgi:predicted GH43/DUF377 family glycosyl hydrolase